MMLILLQLLTFITHISCCFGAYADGNADRADGLTTDLGSFDDGTLGMATLKILISRSY